MGQGRTCGRRRTSGRPHLPLGVGTLAVSVAAIVACGQGRSNAPEANAGGNDGGSSPASGAGGSSGGGGGDATGGRSPSAGSSGAPAGGGVSGQGAAPGAGGAPVGGEAGDATQPPEGGAPAGAAAGSSGASAGTAGTGGALPPSPSAGCALATTTLPTSATLSGFQLRLASTEAYDGVTPMPLLLVFHATSQNSGYAAMANDQAVVERYVVVAPEAPDRRSFDQTNADDATALLDDLRATLCIDESRLFVVGNGSGGRFMMSWLGARDRAGASPRVRAAAMVGTYTRQGLGLALPLLFLHAISSRNSSSVAGDLDGTSALGAFRTFNQCGDSSTPVSVAGCEEMGMSVDPGCVDFQGCAAPLRFCHHDSPDAPGDPWPCFGSTAIVEFFESI